MKFKSFYLFLFISFSFGTSINASKSPASSDNRRIAFSLMERKIAAVDSFMMISEDHPSPMYNEFPHLIHHVWIGHQPYPASWQVNIDRWAALHPDWSQTIWDIHRCTDLVAQAYPWYLDTFTGLTLPIQMADVCRYFILHNHGGLYADMDMYPLASFADILQEATAKDRQVLILERYSDHLQDSQSFSSSYLAIGLMASVPRAAFWLTVFEVLNERREDGLWDWLFDHYRVMHQTGPHCLMAAYFRESRQVGLLSNDLFFPCDILCTAIDQCVADNPQARLIIGYGRTWNGVLTQSLNWFICHIPISFLLHQFLPILLTVLWGLLEQQAAAAWVKTKPSWWQGLRGLLLLAILIYTLVMLLTPLSPYGGWALLWAVVMIGLSLYRHPLSFMTPYLKSRRLRWLSSILVILMGLAVLVIYQLVFSTFVVGLVNSKTNYPVHVNNNNDDLKMNQLLNHDQKKMNLNHHYHTSNNHLESDNMHHALFVIAHPDDESMFFLPTIQKLRELGVLIHLLCMTTGNADGLGSIRVAELMQAADLLGIPSDRVTIFDNPAFADGFDQTWDISSAAQALNDFLDHPYASNHRVVTFKSVFSFDAAGASGHPNHIALHKSLRLAVETLLSNDHTMVCPIHFYTLHTPPLWQRYWGPLALLIPTDVSIEADQFRFSLVNPSLAWHAMRQHASQWVWYRRLFVLFGTLQYVNDVTPLLDLKKDRYLSFDFMDAIKRAIPMSQHCNLFQIE